MNQFEKLDSKLDLIISILESLMDGEEVSHLGFGLDLNAEVSEGDDPPERNYPRTSYEYKTINGDTKTIQPHLLEDKVQEIVKIAISMNEPWQLWEVPDGSIRVMTSNEVVANWNNRHPG